MPDKIQKPWTFDKLPKSADSLTDNQKQIFIAVANRVLEETDDEGLAIAVGLRAAQKVSKAVEDTVSDAVLMKPIKVMVAGDTFFDLSTAWDDFARQVIDDKGKVVVERMLDGQRVTIHRRDNDVKIFTDKGIDITEGLSDVVVSIKTQKSLSFILDAMLVAYDVDDQPQSQQDFSDVAKLSEQTIRGFAIDLLLLDDEDLTEEQLIKRRELLAKSIKAAANLEVVSYSVTGSKDDFEKAVTRESKQVGAIGAVLKDSRSQYEAATTTESWAQFKKSLIFDVRVIGMSRVPLPPPEKRKYTAEEIEVLRPDLFQGSQLFVYRCSALYKNTEVAIEEDRLLTQDDLHLSWNEKDQQWEGFDDPSIWVMAHGVQHRKAGQLAYGKTEASSLTPSPKLGQVIQVQCAGVEEFASAHFSWVYATPQRVKEKKFEVDAIETFAVASEEEAIKESARKRAAVLRIVKADTHYRYVLAVALVPGKVDLQGDVVSEEEIRAAEKEFAGRLGEDHEVLNPNLILERSIVLDEPKTFKNVEGEKVTYPTGTWLIRIKVNDDETWARIRSGELSGVSIEGFADRIKLVANEV